jgi:hypothetical protein
MKNERCETRYEYLVIASYGSHLRDSRGNSFYVKILLFLLVYVTICAFTAINLMRVGFVVKNLRSSENDDVRVACESEKM